jgi:hypothetical protein
MSWTCSKPRSREEYVKKIFSLKHEEKLPLKKNVALYERVLLISEREIYMGVKRIYLVRVARCC